MKTRPMLAMCVLMVAYATGAHANLLTNPGFEAGLTGWINTGNGAIRHNDPAPHQGLNYVFGSSTPLFSVAQEVNLLTAGWSAADIDAGALDIEFGGWQSGWHSQTDHGQISINLLDSMLNVLGSASLPSFFSSSTWEKQSGSTALAAGTRYVRYEFVGTRDEGSNNDSYLDDAYLNVVRSSVPPAQAVPAPSPLSLLVIGLIGLGLLRRRAAPE